MSTLAYLSSEQASRTANKANNAAEQASYFAQQATTAASDACNGVDTVHKIVANDLISGVTCP